MAYFNKDEIKSLIQMNSAVLALLVKFDFKSEVCKIWTGNGVLRSGGEDWIGVGTLISVEGLETAIGTSANKKVLTLSGVDAKILNLVLENEFEFKGRICTIYLQVFNSASIVIGKPIYLSNGVMSTSQYKASGAKNRSVKISLEGKFSRRNRPRFGLWTNADQIRRTKDSDITDTGLEFTESIIGKKVTWPNY